MGTRGAFGFISNGVEKVTYNHFDSYPDGLGKDILEDLVGVDPVKLKERVDALELIDKTKEPTKEQIERCIKFANLDVSTKSASDWYCLLREAQGKLSVYASGDLPYMIDSKNFLFDSLFCEFAYIVNVDNGVLEVYMGFNKSSDGKGRYAKQKNEQGYYGVNLVLEIPLSDITKESVEELVAKMNAACGEGDEEEEEE